MVLPKTRAARTSRSDSSGANLPSAFRRVSVRVGIWISSAIDAGGERSIALKAAEGGIPEALPHLAVQSQWLVDAQAKQRHIKWPSVRPALMRDWISARSGVAAPAANAVASAGRAIWPNNIGHLAKTQAGAGCRPVLRTLRFPE